MQAAPFHFGILKNVLMETLLHKIKYITSLSCIALHVCMKWWETRPKRINLNGSNSAFSFFILYHPSAHFTEVSQTKGIAKLVCNRPSANTHTCIGEHVVLYTALLFSVIGDCQWTDPLTRLLSEGRWKFHLLFYVCDGQCSHVVYLSTFIYLFLFLSHPLQGQTPTQDGLQ